MSQDRHRTAALVERIARVREVTAKQQLAAARKLENQQRSVVETSTGRLCATERSLWNLTQGKALDLARAHLYGDLASAQSAKLSSDCDILDEHKQACAARTKDLAFKTHYRERVSDFALAAFKESRIAHEQRESEALVDSWLLKGLGRARRG